MEEESQNAGLEFQLCYFLGNHQLLNLSGSIFFFIYKMEIITCSVVHSKCIIIVASACHKTAPRPLKGLSAPGQLEDSQDEEEESPCPTPRTSNSQNRAGERWFQRSPLTPWHLFLGTVV